MLLTSTEIDQLKQFSNEQRPIVVGLSGGVDSIALLESLYQLLQTHELDFKLSAIHVHHGLNTSADEWMAFCQQFCQPRQIALTCQKVELVKRSRQSLEAVARDARYLAFTEHSAKNAVIVTAQHLNDQAETLLLRLKRGSGPAGLASMQRLSVFSQTRRLWRPLLGQTKTCIMEFAQRNQLTWVEDDSNNNNDFDRNFLRNQVIPQIEQRWPEFQKCVARSAELCQFDQEIIQQIAEQDFTTCYHSAKQRLDLTQTQSLSKARQFNLVRYWCQQVNEPMPSQVVLTQIIDNFKAHREQQPKVSLQNGAFWQYKQSLYYLAHEQIKQLAVVPENILWQADTELELSNGDKLKTPELTELDRAPYRTEKAEIRFNVSTKTTCRPKYRNCHKTIKQLLQELDIPPWQRNQIGYLFYDEQLVCAIGYWQCEVK